jgi:hypothetical protein
MFILSCRNSLVVVSLRKCLFFVPFCVFFEHMHDMPQTHAVKQSLWRRHEHGLSISGHTHSNNKTAKRLNHYRLYDTTQ